MTVKQPTPPTVPNLDFSKLAKLILQDLNNSSAKKTQSFFTKYTREDVIKYLEKPELYSKNLRRMSNFLYVVSPQYRRLINYFATIHLMQYTVEPYYINYEKLNNKMFLKTYNDLCLTVENMNLQHELIKARVGAWREDIFFGYAHSTKDSFFLQKLPNDYCEITSIVDGCYTYSFDFLYFNGKNKAIFAQFPSEFEEMFAIYKKDQTHKRWQEVDPEKCFCLKISEDIDYPLVPFCSVFASLYDIEDYKALQKTRTALGAYSLLAMTLPLDPKSDASNPYLIDPDEVTKYYNFIASILPPEIGLLLSPTELAPIKFDEEKTQTNRVADSNAQFWTESGVSQLLMSAADGTGASLAKSVITDEALSWSLVKQIERNVNRLVDRYNSETYKFKVSYINSTIFNYKELFDSFITSASYGLPTKMKAAACLGISPNSFNNLLFLENTILDLPNLMIPMQSSATLSSDGTGGAPKKADGVKTASGDKTVANGSNDPANRAYTIDLDEVIE
ncbi:MAG TPA: hypothetical protein VIM70_01570 [Clostridium sp.]|uniref:hypothetical protein n=1 Tax=Clostridium sp. TaxID=1506 RepID=UPI002F95052C